MFYSKGETCCNMNLLKRICALFLCMALVIGCGGDIRAFAASKDNNIYFSDGTSYEDAVRYTAECLADCPDKINLYKFDITPEELSSIYDDILLSRPDIFYLSPKYSYNYDTSNNRVVQLVPEYLYPLSSISKKKKEMETAANEILSGMDKNLPDELKALYLHDMLAVKMEYDENNEIRSAYEGLVKEKALCVAYALAYKYLADKAGLTCICAISTSIQHCWNQVRINGKWYNVDVTYDDPVPDYYGYVSHDFFLVSDNASGVSYKNKDMGHPANDVSFKDSAWSNTETRVIFTGGKCIYVDYKQRGVYSYDYKKNKTDKLFKISGFWSLPDGRYYDGNFSKLEYDGERIYFNTTNKIRSFSPDDPDDVRTEYEANLEEGYLIYGIKIKKGTLYYQTSTDFAKGPYKSYKGIEVSESSSQSSSSSDSTKLDAPMNFRGKIKENGKKCSIALSWKSVEGADGYLVYRYDKISKSSKKIADVTKTSYTAKNLGKGEYSYVVCAYKKVNGKTVKGENSQVLTKKIK